MKMIRTISYSNCDQPLKDSFFTFSLTILSISIMQLCLSLTAKRSTTPRSNEQLDMTKINANYKAVTSKRVIKFKLGDRFNEDSLSENSMNASRSDCFYKFAYLPACKCRHSCVQQIRKIFEKEVWGIFVSLLIKDIPFSIVRTYAVVAPPSNCTLWNQSLFFQLKNYLTIVIQLNRCYVLYNLNDNNKPNDSNGADNNTQNHSQLSKKRQPFNKLTVANISSSVTSSTPPSSSSATTSSTLLSKTAQASSNISTSRDASTLNVANLDLNRTENFENLDKTSKSLKRKHPFWKKKRNKIDGKDLNENSQNQNGSSNYDSIKSNSLTVTPILQRLSAVSVDENSSVSQGPLIF